MTMKRGLQLIMNRAMRLSALIVKSADPVDKVTIIPRGMSLGATHFMPKKNRLSYWRKELVDQLAVLMGGRAAEEVFVA